MTTLWLSLGFSLLATAGADDVIVRQSVDESGVQGDGFSGIISLNADGRWAVFHSLAENLVPGDSNGFYDCFLRDRISGELTRMSLGHDGSEPNGPCFCPVITEDANFVVFYALASNLITDDTNGFYDVFRWERATGSIVRGSEAADGSEANGTSAIPSISTDGRWFAFESYADNLVPGDTNELLDVFVKDMLTGDIVRASVGPGGAEADGQSYCAIISNDGRYVVFTSQATNLIAGDTNEALDVFRHDLHTGVTERVTVSDDELEIASGGTTCAIGFMSRDSRFVTFDTADGLDPLDQNGVHDIYLRDLDDGTTTWVSVAGDGTAGDADSYLATTSLDGTRVAFMSLATSFDPDDTDSVADLYSKDLTSGQLERVTVPLGGGALDGDVGLPNLSDDGRHLAFACEASNLVSDDTNDVSDSFVYGPELTLSLDPPNVPIGQSYESKTWHGAPGMLGALFIFEINGIPFVRRIHLARFDATGVITRVSSIPDDPSLSGMWFKLGAFGFGFESERLLQTNFAELTIE